MVRKMNLYNVSTDFTQYSCFVFANTRNEARTMMVDYFWDEPYIELKARLIKKDVDGDYEVCDVDCDRLAKLGIKYLTEEEIEEFY